MPDYPPFMNATGNLTRILERIKAAQTPPRKRLGLLGSDGSPTEFYRRYRNPDESGAAIAEAMRRGYTDLYRVNENAHTLTKDGLTGLVAQVTGLETTSSTLRGFVGTFEALKAFADFGAPTTLQPTEDFIEQQGKPRSGELRLSTTIYLNLPNTSDIAVFNAIFKSLREHLFQ